MRCGWDSGVLEAVLKIAFVGVGRKERRFDRIGTESGAVIRYFEDYEKAKEWLLMR